MTKLYANSADPDQMSNEVPITTVADNILKCFFVLLLFYFSDRILTRILKIGVPKPFSP